MNALPKFPQIEYAEAAGELKEAYDDMQATLRLPWVAFGVRSLAVFGGYVPVAWRAAKPSFETRYAEQTADALRARALLPGPDPPDPRPTLLDMGWEEAQIDEVRRTLDALNYGNPKYMLLFTAWCEAIQGRSSGGAELSTADAARVPRELPDGVRPLQLVDPDAASPRVKALFKRVTDRHFHHNPSSDYRVLANWPDYLELALEHALEPVFGSDEYEGTARALLVQARHGARGLPTPAGVAPDALAGVCSPSDIAAIVGLLALYQRFILDVTIDMVRLKQAFDGREAAAAPPFRPCRSW
jgi:hypothetical protein